MIKTTFVALALGLLANLPAHAEQPLSTVAQVDVARYSGQWYEIARLPMRFQAQCASDVSAHYRLNDNGSIAEVQPGDVVFTDDGEYHGIENIGDGDLEYIALVINTR